MDFIFIFYMIFFNYFKKISSFFYVLEMNIYKYSDFISKYINFYFF